MKKLCDLHTHSTFSDGTYTPEQIINEAVNIGLSAVALCDHNTVDGIGNFLAAAKSACIEAISGAEFSVDYDGKELHLIGLFIPSGHLSQVSELMLGAARLKEQSNIELIDALGKVGIPLSYDKIKSSTPNGRVNRAHIASALTAAGYTKSVKEAFSTLLSPSAGLYKAPERISVWKMLDFILSIDAVPVLAHPFLNLTPDQLEAFLPAAKSRGLAGMECFYSLYDESTARLALDMAERFGLKPSGGSDFHGERKPGISLGVGRGELRIPYEWCLNLKNK